MQQSPIEWLKVPGYAPTSWNNTRGCKEVSEECARCYARQFAERFRGVEGHPYEFGFDFKIAPFKLEEPLTVERRCAVFVNSMTDLFYGGHKGDKNENPTEYIRDACDVMLKADWHIYIILTKRAERMKKLLNSKDPVFREAAQAKHIWWGVSAGNKANGLPRIKALQETDVRTRCISFEPLLEDLGDMDLSGIHWGKVGGESGPKARSMDKKWVDNIMQQLREQKIARHFKQWGGTRKKKTGRTLNGRTYDEFPKIVKELKGREALPREERAALIENLRTHVRQQWMNHPLLANISGKMESIYVQEEEQNSANAI
jgi:protein gp37